jgi:hypothetical protein
MTVSRRFFSFSSVLFFFSSVLRITKKGGAARLKNFSKRKVKEQKKKKKNNKTKRRRIITTSRKIKTAKMKNVCLPQTHVCQVCSPPVLWIGRHCEMDQPRSVAIYIKDEPADSQKQPETPEELRNRATSRNDILMGCEYLQKLPRHHPTVLDKVKIGYLLHTCSDWGDAKAYVETHDILFQAASDFRKMKMEFHLNLDKHRNPPPKKTRTKRPRQPSPVPQEPHEDATPSHAREDSHPLPLPDVDTYYDDDTYYDQGHSTEVACGRTQVEVHDAAVGPTQE